MNVQFSKFNLVNHHQRHHHHHHYHMFDQSANPTLFKIICTLSSFNQYNLICVASVAREGHVAWRTGKATIVLFGGWGDDAEKSTEIVPGEMACFLPCFVTKYFFFHLYPLYWVILYWRMDDDEAYKNSLVFI